MRYFGTGIWDNFAIPFQVPNLFRRLFGEGALSAALIPTYTKLLHENEQAAKALARSIVALLVIVLSLLTLVGWGVICLYWHLSSQTDETLLSIRLGAIMLPYMVLICSVAVVGGLLNVHRHFAAPAAAPIVLNVCMIAGAVWLSRFFGDESSEQIYAVAFAVLVAGFLQLLLQVPALRSAGISLKPRLCLGDQGLRTIIKLMAPMVVGLSAMQINALMDSLITRFLSATETSGPTFTLAGYCLEYPVQEGAVSALYLAQRLYQFPLGVFGIAISTAIFPLLSANAVKNDRNAFAETLRHGLQMVTFIAVPATIGMILVRVPLVEVLFQGGRFTGADTQQTACALLFYALGIVAYCLQHMVVRAYYSFQDPITPVKIAVRILALNFILNIVLIWPLGTGGVALSTALCAAIQVSILFVTLLKRYKLKLADGILSCVAKTLIATAIMSIGAYWVMSLLVEKTALLQLCAGVTVSVVLYAVASLLLKNQEMYSLLKRH